MTRRMSNLTGHIVFIPKYFALKTFIVESSVVSPNLKSENRKLVECAIMVGSNLGVLTLQKVLASDKFES